MNEEEIPSGELLLVGSLLGNFVKEEDATQRDNIFQSRCLIQEKVCSLIIDGGSCTNFASTRLVSKLQLEIKPHPKPYKLQWLVNDIEMIVDAQVEISFSIGKYEDVAVFDVVPMEATHLLLGRPWQFDKNANHEGRANKYYFVHHGKRIVLASLSPNEARDDQKKLREKCEKEKNEKEKEKNGVILDSCYNSNIFPSCDDFIIKKTVDDIPKEEACKKINEKVLPMEQYNASIELQEKNIGKPRHTNILVPSSNLVCEVKCWVSSNSIHLPNISSLCHEMYNVNEGDCSLQVVAFRELDKDNYAFESKVIVGKAILSKDLANFGNVKATCDGFFRLTFDPGGITARNSRSNSLGEGGNDDNLPWACCPILNALVLF